jgi:hypothetical protein
LTLLLKTKDTPPPPTELEVSNDTTVHSKASAQHRRISLPMMAPFDTNQWYQITLDCFGQRSMVGQPPHAPDTTRRGFFKPTDNAFDGRLWQLYPVEYTRYVLRSQLAGLDTYLAIQNDASSRETAQGNIATMRGVRGTHDEIFWNITPFKNGDYMILNVANGTSWRLRATTLTLSV